jgi:glucose-1-phosphate thymidylyltransferase
MSDCFKGIILAADSPGTGSGWPLWMSRFLLPVYDKPLIWYAISTLMLAGCREIRIVTTPDAAPSYLRMFGSYRSWGIWLDIITANEPIGVPAARASAREWLDGSPCALIRGDTVLWGAGLADRLVDARGRLLSGESGAECFLRSAGQPFAGGVVYVVGGEITGLTTETGGRWDFARAGMPMAAKNGIYSLASLYLFNHEAVWASAGLSDAVGLLADYRIRGRLSHTVLGRGVACFEVKDPDTLLDAASYVRTLERRQGLRIGDPAEIAAEQGWIEAPSDASRAPEIVPAATPA